MARPSSPQPTDVELQILEVLWRRGPSTVRQVHEDLADRRETRYSTTLKMLQVMKQKGLVLRDDSVRPQLYRAAKSKRVTELEVLDHLTGKLFGGSAKRLVMRMLSDKRISRADLAEFEQMAWEAEEGQRAE